MMSTDNLGALLNGKCEENQAVVYIEWQLKYEWTSPTIGDFWTLPSSAFTLRY